MFDRLRVPDVAGTPTLEEAAGEWLREIVRAIFGSVDRKGVRHVGEVLCLVCKKNAKSTGGAAIALTLMLLNTRPRADGIIVAPSQDIADVIFSQMKGMIEADPAEEGEEDGFLARRFQVQEHRKRIIDRKNGSRFMVRSFSAKVMTGVKPVWVLIDETHELGKVPYADEVFREIRGGLMPFPESLLLQFTTQSDAPPAGVFKAELQYARGVRDGRITTGVRLLPVLYEFPEAVQTSEDRRWEDPELWGLVNPNMGRSVHLDRLVADYAKATEDGLEEQVRFATKHLNVEVGLALHSNRWRGADHWTAAADAFDLEDLLARSEVCTAGIDGGGLDDLFGLAVIGREKVSKRWLLWAHAWAHRDVFARRKSIAGQLRQLEKAGVLTVCETPTQDIEETAALVARIAKAGLLPEKFAVGLDPYGVAALIDELAGHGIDDEQMSAIRQGAALSPAVWGLERKLADGTAVHSGQPLLGWSIGNAVAEQRGNAVLITKQTAGKTKIDPLIALFNAAMLMQRNPAASRRDLSAFLSRPVMVA